MGIYETINAVLAPVLIPLKSFGPVYVILLISFLISLLVTLVYKWTTDQELMKSLKDDIKRHQQEMKKLRNDPSKMMKVQKEAMDKNMKYMMHSFKSTLITFVPLILIFGWLNASFAYDPIKPGETFSTYVFFEENGLPQNATIKVPDGIKLLSNQTQEIKMLSPDEQLPFKNTYLTSSRYGGFMKSGERMYYSGWQMSGNAGEYLIEYYVGGNSIPYTNKVLISKTEYEKPFEKVEDGVVRGVMVDEGKLITMNLFGWKLGWLGAYIIFSIIFSMVLRKFLKVY